MGWALIPTLRPVSRPLRKNSLSPSALSVLRNYWVNMQSCVDGLKDIEYDLQDSSRWEFMVRLGIFFLYSPMDSSISTLGPFPVPVT